MTNPDPYDLAIARSYDAEYARTAIDARKEMIVVARAAP
jgi:hypothetical protein